MSSLEERLEHLEAQIAEFAPPLRERVERLEQAVRPSALAAVGAPPARRSFFGVVAAAGNGFVRWMGAELPKLLGAGVLLFIGWGIKDSVDLSIKQRQLDLSYAKEMQALLLQMADPDADSAQLEKTAVVLSSFGEAALPSLLSELRFTGLRANAAAFGIASLALTRPAATCEALPRVLMSRSKQYDWQAHQRVVRLLAGGGCVDATATLQRYREIVAAARAGNAAALQDLVRALPAAPTDDYPDLLKDIDEALASLARAKRSGAP